MRFSKICRWTPLLLIMALAGAGLAAEENRGITATFRGAGKVDSMILPNFTIYLPAGQSPTPFLAEREYTVELAGLVSVDLRGQYAFLAELNGEVVLTANGNTVLEASGNGTVSEPGKTVRLNKGTNALVAKFTPPKEGDGWIRIFWAPRDALPSLMPEAALSYARTPELERSLALRRGRELFAEFRCAKCHTTELKGMAELEMDAPSFDGIGSRLNATWMAKWIENPAENRNLARMPRIFHGEQSAEDARAVAAYLGSLKEAGETKSTASGENEVAEKGQHLFQALHCGACHNTPGSDEKDPARISLTHAREKFQPGALKAFLLNPQAHYSWIRMPNFKLSELEAEELSTFLESKAAAPIEGKLDTGLIKRGEELVSKSGCMNCHSGKVENRFSGKPLDAIAKGTLEAGCLAKENSGKAPLFPWQDKETDLASVREFIKAALPSLKEDNAMEFAARQTRLMNCAGCHGKFEGFPAFELLGLKLKPEWSAKFIAGKVDYKPRPWLEARMPSFPARAEEIAQGLAMMHAYPAKTPAEPEIDHGMAEVGQKLVSAVGGFSCISCHSVGSTAATQVFESAGINLAYSGERLQKAFYHKWVLNPLAIDPTTKMPVYFDAEGRSPLTDVYEGDGKKQIEAIWQYIRLGDKMPPPPLQ